MKKKERKGGTPLQERIIFYLTPVVLLLLTYTAAYAASRIEVSNTSFDFGHIDEGHPAIATVHLKNSGDADILIEEVICS